MCSRGYKSRKLARHNELDIYVLHHRAVSTMLSRLRPSEDVSPYLRVLEIRIFAEVARSRAIIRVDITCPGDKMVMANDVQGLGQR